MKNILCFALICLFAPCVYGSGWVQGVNATAAGTTSVSVNLPNLSAAGNYLVCGVASASTADTFAISDTQSNVWGTAGGVGFFNGDGVHAVQAFEAKNIAGGPDTITLTGTLSTTHWLACQEWYQVGMADMASVTPGTTANPACGALSVTTVNDGIAGFIVNTATPNTGPVLGGTSAQYLMTGNAVANMGMQYSVADQSGRMQPQFTNATAGTWTCIALELKDNSGFVKNPNLKLGTVAYGSKYMGGTYSFGLAVNWTSWSNKVYDWIVNTEAGTPYPYGANTINAAYFDSQGMYQFQWYGIRLAGLANAGWDPERFIYHFGIDYEVTTNWPREDEFDYFDGGNNGSTITGVNGALIYNGTAYSDVTTTLYSGTCGAACTLSNSGYFLYLGYGVPFDRANFVFTTPMTGGTVTWQYWNGTAWTNFGTASDGTNGFTTNGQVVFTPPANWTQTTVNSGTHSKYWVRLSVGTPTVAPVLKTIRGDDWFAAAVIDFDGTNYVNCEVPDSNCLNGSTPIPLTNTRYFGGSTVFQTVNPTVGVANVGGVITWSYWNGTAWTTFTPLADATNGFTIAGRNTIQFPTLAGWAKVAVPSEGNAMFYVRAQISGQTTAPTISDFDGINNDRGWCSTCTHLNSGISGVNADLEYDPNPPANQTAHFRHQARWQSLHQDYGALNTNDQQSGVYTYPQAQIGRWNTALASGNALYNGLMNDNAGGGFQNANMVTPNTFNGWYYNIIESACYPNCSATNPPLWGGPMVAAMTAVTAAWHNPSSTMYQLTPGTYDSRKMLNVTFNIVGISMWGLSGGNALRGTSDVAQIEMAMSYAINAQSGFDVPVQYMDSFLTSGNCTTGGCNTSNQLGVIEFHDDVAPLIGNFHVQRGTASAPINYWHTIDTASIVPMAALAAYKIGENANTIFYLQPGGTIYDANDDYYYWPTTTTTLTAPINVGPSNTQTIAVANGAACPAIPINTGELGGSIVMQFGTTTGPGVPGTADVMFLKSTPAVGPNTYTGASGNGPVNFVNAYPVGTVVRCAVIGHLSMSAPPPLSQMFMWTSYFPAMNTDLGVPNTAGWMGGNRDMAFLAGNVISPLGTAGCGANGCPPVERRDFTHAIILFRPITGTTLDSETQMLSNNIGLTNTSQNFTPPYYRLAADGTLGPAITTVQLRAGEAAILMTQGAPNGPAISSLTPPSGPAGTVVTIAGSNFTATQGTVTFGGVQAIPTAWSNASITVPVPAGAATGQVVVTAGGAASNPVLFTVSAPTGPPFSFTSFVPPIF